MLCGWVSDKDLADSLEDLLGGTLEVNSDVVGCSLGFLLGGVCVTDEQVELDGGGEGDLELVAVFTPEHGVVLSDLVEGVLLARALDGAKIFLHEHGGEEADKASLRGITLGHSLHESSAWLGVVTLHTSFIGNHHIISILIGLFLFVVRLGQIFGQSQCSHFLLFH